MATFFRFNSAFGFVEDTCNPFPLHGCRSYIAGEADEEYSHSEGCPPQKLPEPSSTRFVAITRAEPVIQSARIPHSGGYFFLRPTRIPADLETRDFCAVLL